MRFSTKVMSGVAAASAAALGVGLLAFAPGVGANFSDTATATADVNVGDFGCVLSSSSKNVAFATDSDGNQTATISLNKITSSVAGSQTVPVTVTNPKDIRLVVNWTVTARGSIFNSGAVTPAAVDQNLAVSAGNARTYNLGIQYTTLGNDDLGTKGSVTYKATCMEAPSTAHPSLLLYTLNGGKAAWNADGSLTFKLVAQPDAPSGTIDAVNAYLTDPDPLPKIQPTIKSDSPSNGAPKWVIILSDGTTLQGWPNLDSPNWGVLDSSNQPVQSPSSNSSRWTWDEIAQVYAGANVSSAQIVTFTGMPENITVGCATYASVKYIDGSCS